MFTSFTINEYTLLLCSYLLGSIPFGFIITKLVGKTDIRKHGSGNIGATNVGMLLGKKCGKIVFLLDGLKGIIPVLIAKIYFKEFGDLIIALAAILAVVGHILPVWLKFKGGKGVSTTILILLIIDWKLLICFLIVWLFLFYATGLVSLGAILGPIITTIFSYFTFSTEITLMCLVLSILITIRHKSNIYNILQKNGKERNFRTNKLK